MNCPACGAENPETNRFCGACGSALVLACTACGTENPLANRFCGACGAPLVGQPKPEPTTAPRPETSTPEPATPDRRPVQGGEAERRQLTVMFCDLVGSTALSGRLDPEDLQEVMQAHRETCAGAIARYEGYVAKYLGDGILAYFGYPVAHGQDAERAVRAGLAIIAAMDGLNARLTREKGVALETRIGIATGPVVVGEMGSGGGAHESMAVVGETPNIAARLEGVAQPNQVVIGPLTRRLIGDALICEDLGEHALKGVARPVRAYAVIADAASETREEALTPLVGRDDELARLAARWAKAKAGHRQVVLIGGEPGIGKTRLVQAVYAMAEGDGGAWIECHGSPYHLNTPLHPFIETFERRIGLDRGDDEATRRQKLAAYVARFDVDAAETVPVLAALLGIDLAGRYPTLELSPSLLKQRTLETILALLGAVAARAPIVLSLENLQWVDASTRELFDLIVERASDFPLLLLLTHRSEFAAPWPDGPDIEAIALGRLDADASAAIVRAVAGDKTLPDDVVDQIVQRTDGVPLFIEEMTKMLLESDFLEERDGRYEPRGPLPASAIPETLQDSLMARLDRLADAKELAQIGATIGRSFTHELIEAVSQAEATLLAKNLTTLREQGLIQMRGEPPHAIYSFRQALLQEIAYESLLRRRRQHYHRRIAEILEADFPEVVSAQPDLLAHHYTVAGDTERAIDYWRKAGERAFKRSANVEAVEHFTKGLELIATLPETQERTRQELGFWASLAPSRLVTKGYAAPESKEAFENAYALGQQVGDPEVQFPSSWGITAYHFIRGEMATARQLADEMIANAEAADNDGFRVVALASMGIIEFSLGGFERSVELVERGLELYDPDAHRPLMHRFGQDIAVLCTAYGGRSKWILGYPDQALEMVERSVALAREARHPFTLATALCTGSGFARLLRGEVAETRACAEEAFAIADEQRFAYLSARALILLGWCLVQEGETEDGIARLRDGLAAFRKTGALTTVPFGQALLADALADAGRADEGLDVVAEALEHVRRTSERDCEAELHRVKGELLCAGETGNDASAAACFERARDIARKQKARSWELRAAMSLARLYGAQGRSDDAHAALAPIHDWFEEGLGTADLKAASTLLKTPSST